VKLSSAVGDREEPRAGAPERKKLDDRQELTEGRRPRGDVTASGARGWNLPDFGWARWFRAQRWFTLGLQIATTALLIVMIGEAWGIVFSLLDDPGRNIAPDRGLWIATLVWKLFWPGLVLMTICFGRIWCTVCPLELISRLGRAVGVSARAPSFRIPKWAAGGWTLALAFILMSLFAEGLNASESAHLTGAILLVLTGAAALSGVLFHIPRAFCALLCPSAAMLSSYSRCAALPVVPVSPPQCDRYPDRVWVVDGHGDGGGGGQSRASSLRSSRRWNDNACLVCLSRSQLCPSSSIDRGTGSAAIPRGGLHLHFFEAVFVSAAAGLLAREFVGTSQHLHHILNLVPRLAAQSLPAVAGTWFETVWYLLLLPVAFSVTLLGVARLRAGSDTACSILLACCGGALPIVAVAHCLFSVCEFREGTATIRMYMGAASQNLTPGSTGLPTSLSSLPMFELRTAAVVGALVAIGMVAKLWRRHGRSSRSVGLAAGLGLSMATALFASLFAVALTAKHMPSIVYLHGATAGGSQTVEGQLASGPQSACRLVRARQNAARGCRADWLCAGSGMHSFFCVPAGELGVRCYCALDEQTVVTGIVDDCGTDEESMSEAARHLCNWKFLSEGKNWSRLVPARSIPHARSLGLIAD
jgi:hypothetical protein